MKTRINEDVKLDIALVSQALNNTNVTGQYLSMKDYRSACFLLNGGALAATKTTKLEILQATDNEGSDAKVFDSTAADNAEKTVTANAYDVASLIALASVANTDVVTINGVDFTKAASTDASANEFADAAGLVTCVNAYFDDLFASASTTNVTIIALDGKSDVTITKTENAGTITLSTVQHQIYVEIKASDLDTDNDFLWVAPKVTTTGDTVVSVAALRGNSRFTPDQIGLGKNL